MKQLFIYLKIKPAAITHPADFIFKNSVLYFLKMVSDTHFHIVVFPDCIRIISVEHSPVVAEAHRKLIELETCTCTQLKIKGRIMFFTV